MIVLLKPGIINPISKPYLGPRIKPANKTGICMGKSIDPKCGMFPVIKGKTSPRPISKALITIFLLVFFIFPPFPNQLQTIVVLDYAYILKYLIRYVSILEYGFHILLGLVKVFQGYIDYHPIIEKI